MGEHRTIIANPLLFNDRGEVCLVQRKKSGVGTYSTPGGKFEPGENLSQATIREINEETGVTAEAQDLEFIDSYTSFNSKTGKEMLHLVVLVKKYQGTPYNAAPDENSNIGFFNTEDPSIVVSMYTQPALDIYNLKYKHRGEEDYSLRKIYPPK